MQEKNINFSYPSKEILQKQLDTKLKDQLRRAAISIVLNIAEGSSRFSQADRKNFFVIARRSSFECNAVLDLIETTSGTKYPEIEIGLVEISKMLFKMISSLSIARKDNQTEE